MRCIVPSARSRKRWRASPPDSDFPLASRCRSEDVTPLMHISPLIDRLIEAFQVLPGVGPKTAQRMALAILRQQRSGGKHLADALLEAIDKVGYCRRCRTFSELDLCGICQDTRREQQTLCVVE